MGGPGIPRALSKGVKNSDHAVQERVGLQEDQGYVSRSDCLVCHVLLMYRIVVFLFF